MANSNLEKVLSLLKNVKRSGDGYSARCPAHDDNKNSLLVKDGANGKLFFKCFAGCSYQDVAVALGISSNGTGQRNVESIYNYTDENGVLLYQSIRFEGKEFRWRRFDKDGREHWNLDGVRRVPYRLADLIKLPKDLAFVMAEGEKDADNLTKAGLTATSHKNWNSEFNYLLKGRKVVIFQDHDKPGARQVEDTAKMIVRDAEVIKIVDCFANEPLPDKHGKDVSDYLETHNFEELLELIRNSQNWNPHGSEDTSWKSGAAQLKVFCLSDVKAESITWLWKPFIPIGEFTILEGVEGLGKSWLCCAIASAVAGGDSLPFSESEPIGAGNVLMLSAEDSISHTVKPRLLSMDANTDRIFAIDEVFSFSDLKDSIKFEAVVAEYQPHLIIIDPVFSYTGGRDLNQESSSRPIARKLIEIAQKYQCAVIGVRHIGKSKGQGDPRAAGLGSIAWRASARSVLLVGKDEETGETAIVQTKSNLSEKSKIAVGFEIKQSQFCWSEKPSNLTPERMLSQQRDTEAKAEQTKAIEFWLEVLRDGDRSSKEVEKVASQIGISKYALRKARTILKIESFKKGGNFGGDKSWYVRLPSSENPNIETEDDDNREFQHLQPIQSNKTIYDNNLTELVENSSDRQIQHVQTTSSNGHVPQVRMNSTCKCGADGFVGETCVSCGKVLIPF